jgi:hypothetical protein
MTMATDGGLMSFGNFLKTAFTKMFTKNIETDLGA